MTGGEIQFFFFMAMFVINGVIGGIAVQVYYWKASDGLWQWLTAWFRFGYPWRFWRVHEEAVAAGWQRCAGITSWICMISFVGMIAGAIVMASTGDSPVG